MNEGTPRSLEVGVAFFQAHPPQRFIELVQLAERCGYAQLWVASERFYRDPTVMLALAAAHTRRVGIGTFVADPYSENPALIAARIATLDELSEQRATLVLGAGGTGLQRMGIRREKPLAALREATRIIRAMLGGETVDFAGQVFNVHGARLAFPARPTIPIYFGTRGKKMLELAGEIADGVMISTFATPAGIEYAKTRIAAGARRADRSVGELKLVCRVDVCMHPDPQVASRVIRRFLCRSLAASYPDRSWVEAVGVTIPPGLESVFAQRDGDLAQSAADELPAEMATQFAWTGTPEQIAGQISAVTSVGIESIAVVPQLAPGQTLEDFITSFSNEVVPHIQVGERA